MEEGHLFSYRADLDSISLIDNPSEQGTACAGFLDKRVATYISGSNTIGQAWVTDRQAGQTGTATITSPVWDWGLPFESHKVLLGFRVQTDALSVSDTVKVEYQTNEDGTWTQAGSTLTSGTDNWLQVSDAETTEGGSGVIGTVAFNQLRVRATILFGNPKVYAISVYDYNANFGETLEYVVLLSSEDQYSGDQYEAWDMTTKIRYLEDLQSTRKIVTVVDGYEASDPRDTVTYPLMVMEDLNIIIYGEPGSENENGVARFTMRNLDTP